MEEFRSKSEVWGGNIPKLLEDMFLDALGNEPGKTTYVEVNGITIIMVAEGE